MADTSIYRNMLGAPKSVADYDNAYAAQQMNLLGMKEKQNALATHQRDLADEQANRAAYSSSGGDAMKYRNNLVQTGNARAVQAFDESQQKLQKNAADIGHVGAQTDQASSIAAKNKNEMLHADVTREATQVMQAPTIENARAAVIKIAAKHGTDPTQDLIRLSQMKTPDEIKQWAAGQALTAEKLLPKLDAQNLGGAMSFGAVDPITGKRTETGTQKITETANNISNNLTSVKNNELTNETSRRNNAATVGASLANASATREVAKSNVTAAGLQRDQATEMKLSDDYRKQSKEFGDSTSAFKQINATLDSANKSPAATLAAATKFMKILDPNSVVRESELGMALAASGVLDRAGNYINTLQNGKTLTKSQVADFKKIAADMYEAAKQVQQNIDKDYKLKADTYKLRPEMVLQDLGQNTVNPAKPSGNKPTVSNW